MTFEVHSVPVTNVKFLAEFPETFCNGKPSLPLNPGHQGLIFKAVWIPTFFLKAQPYSCNTQSVVG